MMDTGAFSSLPLQCRYTLQYTYPYAYYMESGPRKKLVRQAGQSLYSALLASEVPWVLVGRGKIKTELFIFI